MAPEQVLVSAGCNRACCLVTSALAEPGEEVILTLPTYFNHDMWLRLDGVTPVHLEPGPGLVPTVEAAEQLMTPRTRALVLVSPGNPTGLTLDPDTIADFAELARRHGIALIVDETYRSFRGTDQPAHTLFSDSDWPDVLVGLHSFSKDLAIPGYRVGAVVASADRNGGFELLSAGGYFGWVRHPYEHRPTGDVVRDLAVQHDTLVIPGTAFQPDDRLTAATGQVPAGTVAGDEPTRVCMIMHWHAYFYLCPRCSLPCPSANASGSPSPVASTPR